MVFRPVVAALIDRLCVSSDAAAGSSLMLVPAGPEAIRPQRTGIAAACPLPAGRFRPGQLRPRMHQVRRRPLPSA